jgi:U3 small nucleolar RNA-associated protein 7
MLPLGGIRTLRFCPYEDVLGAGCAGGVSSLLIPGAGEPNFDSFVANPFQNKKERQEQEVVQLLDKLQPDTIMLDPDAIAKVNTWTLAGQCRGWWCWQAEVPHAVAAGAATDESTSW